MQSIDLQPTDELLEEIAEYLAVDSFTLDDLQNIMNIAIKALDTAIIQNTSGNYVEHMGEFEFKTLCYQNRLELAKVIYTLLLEHVNKEIKAMGDDSGMGIPGKP